MVKTPELCCRAIYLGLGLPMVLPRHELILQLDRARRYKLPYPVPVIDNLHRVCERRKVSGVQGVPTAGSDVCTYDLLAFESRATAFFWYADEAEEDQVRIICGSVISFAQLGQSST